MMISVIVLVYLKFPTIYCFLLTNLAHIELKRIINVFFPDKKGTAYVAKGPPYNRPHIHLFKVKPFVLTLTNLIEFRIENALPFKTR